jgi:cytoskeletal protein CcmA (bactofilin family)
LRARTWRSDGAAKILGNVEVEEGETRGVASIRGTLVAARFRAGGTLDVLGDARVAEEIALRGTGRFGASLTADRLTADGTIDIAAALRAKSRVEWTGVLEASDLSAPAVRFRGRARVSGDLVSENLDARLEGGVSRVTVLRARALRVARAGFPPWRRGSLVAERIEAIEAELEGVRAEYVRADRVRVGPDCHLSRVDGRIVRRHRSAHIGPESESEVPPWLTR